MNLALGLAQLQASQQGQDQTQSILTVSEAEAQSQWFALRIQPQSYFGDDSAGTTTLSESELVLEAMLLSLVEEPQPLIYYNYTALEYLALKEALGEDLVIGDQGSYVAPVYDDAGLLGSYAVSTWIVTDVSGTFQAVVIPEPTAAASMLAGLGLLLSRRRCR